MSVPGKTTVSALRRWCYGDNISIDYHRLDKNLLSWAWFYDHQILPDEIKSEAQLDYQNVAAWDMRQEAGYQQLCGLLENEKIRFVPLKGADLAWRVYPDGALRVKGDLDIAFHPDDYERAIAVLKSAGWQIPFKVRCDHHHSPMTRNGVTIEPHFALPGFRKCNPHEVWSELQPVANGFRHQLPRDFNLLMLFNHARNHKWGNGITFLRDCAMLLQKEGKPDWTAVHKLATRFHVASPDLLFAAFDDFFSPEVRSEIKLSTEICEIFRRMLLTVGDRFSVDKDKFLMADSNRFSFQWWQMRLRGMSPASIRSHTNNPRGHYGKLLLGYLQISAKKLRTFWKYRHGNLSAEEQKLKDELEIIDRVIMSPNVE